MIAAGGVSRSREIDHDSNLYATFRQEETRWAEARERDLLVNGPPAPKKEVPTLREFTSRFIDGHARANQHKPGGIAQKETVLRVHLIPRLGAKRLDAICTEDVQRLKCHLAGKKPKPSATC